MIYNQYKLKGGLPMYLFDFDSEKIDKDSIFDNLSHLEVELSELQADLHRAKLHRYSQICAFRVS